MNQGPLVFVAALFALAASWTGFVLAPQIQLGREQQSTNSVNSAELYPQARPGLARQGLEVYRANGCAACHTQQVGQDGVDCYVLLSDVGTNPVAVAEALLKANVGITKASGPGLSAGLPKTVLRAVSMDLAKTAVNALKSGGAKARVEILPYGPDIARGWGMRRSVAADYLYDDTVMPGSQRIGPDLANAGLRLPDPNWHLLHLYAPALQVSGSTMPAYRYLFERRKIGRHPSPNALALPVGTVPAGDEVVPRPEAEALAAYLVSLRCEVPLFEAPLTPPPSAPAQTNSAAK